MKFSPEYFSKFYICYYYGGLIHCSSKWKEIDTVCSYSKFYYILDGECIIKINDEEYVGKKGRLFLIPSGTKHSFYHINDNHIKKYWFHFTMELGQNDFFNMIESSYYIDIEDNRKIKRIFKDIIKYSFESNLQGVLYLKARIIEMVAFYFTVLGTDGVDPISINDEELANVLQYIKDNLHRYISIKELADIIHLHPNYFIRFFKERLGTSPIKHINKLRIEQIKSLLENTNISINDIMQQFGFNDPCHFSKFFKNHTGYSPKQFRIIYKK